MLLSALGSASGTRCHPPRGRDAACSSSRDSRALISPRPCRENGPCGKKAGLRRVDVRNATSGAAAAGGSWKLEKEFMPIFIELADGIEGAMRRELGAGLSDLEVPQKFHWANVEGFTMENRFYQSKVFRKTHMELAVGGKGLQILHFVMYPFAEYALPMYSLDMVAFGSRVTLAIADVCPVTPDLSLPPAYAKITELKQKHLGHLPPREVPEWGTRCLSKACACVSPDDPEAVKAFVNFALALFDEHLKIAKSAAPSASKEEVATTLKAQQSYCTAQLENIKTRRVLENFFGEEFTAGYMEGVMFDVTETTPIRAMV